MEAPAAHRGAIFHIGWILVQYCTNMAVLLGNTQYWTVMNTVNCVWCYSEHGTAEIRSSEQYLPDLCSFTSRWRQLGYRIVYIARLNRTMVVSRPWYTDGRRSSLCCQRCQSDIRSVMWNILCEIVHHSHIQHMQIQKTRLYCRYNSKYW